jgi:hypothetical protein
MPAKNRVERMKELLGKTVTDLVTLYKRHNRRPKDLPGVRVIEMIDSILDHEFPKD